MQHQHNKKEWTKAQEVYAAMKLAGVDVTHGSAELIAFNVTQTEAYDYVEMKWQETNDKKHTYWYCPICFAVVRVET